MTTYFSYCHIIASICESITKHAYIGDWTLCDSTPAVQSAVTQPVQISEIYY